MSFLKNSDIKFMKLALIEARKARQLDEIPVGAIIVSKELKIIGKGHNMVESKFSQTEHAEMRAIKQAGKKLANWRLSNCTIYVTLQPCLMCLGVICLSRITRIVFGAYSEVFSCKIDKENLPDIYKKHIKGITSGIMENESFLLLKEFFTKKREQCE